MRKDETNIIHADITTWNSEGKHTYNYYSSYVSILLVIFHALMCTLSLYCIWLEKISRGEQPNDHLFAKGENPTHQFGILYVFPN